MDAPTSGQGRNQAVTAGYEDDGTISLRPYTDTLRRYRRVIGTAVAAVTVLFVVGLIGMLVVFPRERVASIQFRVLFEGASLNQYPNKMPFSPTEIVGPPIVTEVFNRNDLKQYGKYESFKEALFIQQSNPELDLLAYQYQSKLADPKLNPVDRARIEAEFSQKRAALTDPSFSLSLRRSERFRALPDDLAQKILNDTLAEWATQAERMGAMKYQLPILSSVVLSKDSLEHEDYLIAVDMLRAKALRIMNTISELEEVPGALTIRTSKDSVSLPEIRANIEDALRFDLEPLLGVIRSEGVTKNGRLLTLYAETQVFQLRLERQAAEGRARAVQTSLAEYMAQRGVRTDSKTGATQPGRSGLDAQTVIPQFSESFLDRLVEMSASTQKSEMEYRQKLTDLVIKENTRVTLLDKELAYYEDLYKSVRNIGSRPTGSSDLIKMIKSRSETGFAAIAKGADQLMMLYGELSSRNLNPVARLYEITGPFTRHSQSAVSWRSAALSYALLLMLTLIVVPVGCLVHSALKRRARA